MSELGVYILTYPGDYHLSSALIRSLRHFGCDVPIVIIPGEGVDPDDNPFDVPVMTTPGGFWGRLGHADRKFWAFQGPFERFVYLDADIICTRPVEPFLAQVSEQPGRFVAASIPVADDDWRRAVADTDDELHDMCVRRVPSQLGNVSLLAEFDPVFDPYARYPFNSGLFASRRGAITEEELEELHLREREFFERRLDIPFSWRSHRLFFGDQGRLNYLVDRLGIDLRATQPTGDYRWGGEAFEVPLDEVLAGQAPCNFVHWAGTPRPSPSLFCRRPLLAVLPVAYPLAPRFRTQREIPAYSVWRHFATGDSRRDRLRDRLAWTWRDARVLPRRTVGRVVRGAQRALRARSVGTFAAPARRPVEADS